MILLNTDVVSFFMKRDTRSAVYESAVKGQRVAVSFMTAAELYQWAELAHWGERRRGSLEKLLKERYAVLGFELGLGREWARVRSEGRAAGQPISVQDGWVAATARYYSLPLLSHNRKHFEDVRGLKLLPNAA